jgi:hypothetical protein
VKLVDHDTDELLGMHVLAHMGTDLLTQGILLLHTPWRTVVPLTACFCITASLPP